VSKKFFRGITQECCSSDAERLLKFSKTIDFTANNNAYISDSGNVSQYDEKGKIYIIFNNYNMHENMQNEKVKQIYMIMVKFYSMNEPIFGLGQESDIFNGSLNRKKKKY
jgi:hypothetical protein